MSNRIRSQKYNILNVILSLIYVVISIILIGDRYHSGVLFPIIMFVIFILISISLSVYDLLRDKRCCNWMVFLLFHCFSVFAFTLSLVILLNVKPIS
ncbi:MAG: hypothetical protein KKH92_07865 [Firmicutes bacterium]|nr:hypothetical protein [Bacillota bacterium]